MDFSRDPTKLKSITSLLFGKKERKKPAMQTPTTSSSTSSLLEPGLKTLTNPTINFNPSLTCIKPNLSSFSSPSSLSSLSTFSSSSVMDEVGKNQDKQEKEADSSRSKEKETGIDDNGEEEEEEGERSYRRRRSFFREKREYPPPIPLLARTGNLLCHMPWILKRSYTENSRLVIQEVKVKHHDCFRAQRADGRLTLKLMHMDEAALSFPRPNSTTPDERNEKEEEEEEEEEEETEEEETGEEETEEVNREKAPIQDAKEVDDQPPSSSSSLSEKERETQEKNPSPELAMSSSSLPPPPSLLRDHLKERLVLDHKMDSLPFILSSSMPESSFGIGGNGSSGCFDNRLPNSLFQLPIPTIRPIHS